MRSSITNRQNKIFTDIFILDGQFGHDKELIKVFKTVRVVAK